jgi:hypothetical protein
MDLPGFSEPSDVFTLLEDGWKTRWQTVLSTTVVANLDGGLHVLTGNRIAEGNRTHVNVASTPTMRIPSLEAGLLLAESIPFCLSGNIEPMKPFVSKSLGPSVAAVPDNSDELGSKVGNLLALKLGLGQAIERARKPIGRASIARCIIGFSYIEDNASGEPLYEPLIMLGAVVGLEEEAARTIPDRTSSYSHLGWTELHRYTHGVATKNLREVLVAAEPADELEVCVRGLCNATSSTIVNDAEEIQRHLTEDGILSRI